MHHQCLVWINHIPEQNAYDISSNDQLWLESKKTPLSPERGDHSPHEIYNPIDHLLNGKF